jgi:hypothetical protein
MRKPAKAALIVLLGVTVLCCGGGVIGMKVERTAKNNGISPETYRKVQVGQAEADVRQIAGKTGSIAKEAVSGDEPPIPAGATCAYALSDEPSGDATSDVFRFCFAGGKLVQKQEIQGSSDAGPGGY